MREAGARIGRRCSSAAGWSAEGQADRGRGCGGRCRVLALVAVAGGIRVALQVLGGRDGCAALGLLMLVDLWL